MAVNGPFIAIDWGTTNRRAYVIHEGKVIHSERDGAGAAAVSDFPGEAAALRSRLGDLPMLMAGMVGSGIGWRQVRYVPAPASLADLAANVEFIDERTAIIPGISWTRDDLRCDVMRGEEVQLLGAMDAGAVPNKAVLCQPGTHCKWAWLDQGCITRFVTSMTGELLALLRGHSLLAAQIETGSDDGEAFARGVSLGSERDLGAALFSVRADGLLGRLSNAEAASFTSGILIGSDVAVRLLEIGKATVHILADAYLGGLYSAAIAQLGGHARIVSSHDAFVAGICAIQERLK
nr:2-dehydro-3-deoxygalactonokinase [Novosphingobium sp. fls2-241-R2A-195]